MQIHNQQLVQAFSEFIQKKGINKPIAREMLQEVFVTLVKKIYGEEAKVHTVVNPDTGDIQVFRMRSIVADDDPNVKEPYAIALSEARKIEEDFELGEEVADEIKVSDFSRRAIANALQALIQKQRMLDNEKRYNAYVKQMEGGYMVNAQVHQIDKKRHIVLYDEAKEELFLPRTEQLAKDHENMRIGATVQAVIKEVQKLPQGRVKVILSRADPNFLKLLLHQEIDEIRDGVITIVKVVRRPGERAKVVVTTDDDRIDPVSACVGSEGRRIRVISRMIDGEQIDIINHTDNRELYIRRLLKPAKVSRIEEDDERIKLFLQQDQVALAIGRKGQNINLASTFIGKPMDIYQELDPNQQDLLLKDLKEPIDAHLLELLASYEIFTTKQILKHPPRQFAIKLDLSQAVVDDLYAHVRKQVGV